MPKIFDWKDYLLIVLMVMMFAITLVCILYEPFNRTDEKIKMHIDCYGAYEHCIETDGKIFPQKVQLIIDWK